MTYSHRLHADMLPADSPHSPGMKCATGSQAFSEKVLKIGKSLIKKDRHWSYQQSQEQKAHGQLEAERLLAEERRIAGLKESGLPNRLLSYKPAKFPGGDLRKIAIASRIARATIVNMEWINQKLQMKIAANVRQDLWRLKRKEEDLRRLPKTLRTWRQ